jgi:hypothetical protein
MNVLRVLLDICLLRGKPQDLPTSTNLLAAAAVAGVVVDYLSLPDRRLDLGQLAFVLFQVALFGAGVWAVLKLRGVPARWIQTATALFAANALFSLLLLPLLPALEQMLKAGPEATPGWQGYAMLLISGWFLLVMSRVLREAMESSLLASFFTSLGLIFGVRVVGLVFAPLFGIPAEA